MILCFPDLDTFRLAATGALLPAELTLAPARLRFEADGRIFVETEGKVSKKTAGELIALNVTAYIERWDPYPFILLNLLLSFQAAYAAPVIMMSQNRQQAIDRREAASDYRINVKAELEIESLHAKVDELREKEVLALTQAVHELTMLLKTRGPVPAAPPA